jgi:hypothetical protein
VPIARYWISHQTPYFITYWIGNQFFFVQMLIYVHSGRIISSCYWPESLKSALDGVGVATRCSSNLRPQIAAARLDKVTRLWTVTVSVLNACGRAHEGDHSLVWNAVANHLLHLYHIGGSPPDFISGFNYFNWPLICVYLLVSKPGNKSRVLVMYAQLMTRLVHNRTTRGATEEAHGPQHLPDCVINRH